jgi:copper chaperone CopZ
MDNQIQRFEVKGMHCGGCAGKIRTALHSVSGVQEASVSHETGGVDVQVKSGTEPSELIAAIESAGDYSATSVGASAESTNAQRQVVIAEESTKESLYPLFLIVGFIAGVTLLVAYGTNVWALESVMRHFMAGFFLVFSFFKLLDPPGFVSAYRGYDLIAKKVPVWGWVYPLVELGLGVAYLLAWMPLAINIVTLLLMLVGAAGVLNALLNKRAIRCACLGTALNLPMTKVTLVEDLTMAVMAGAMLAML